MTLAEKVAFLRRAASYPDAPARVDERETRFSWVFLTDRFAYKLKKPVITPLFDLTTPALRRANAEAEVSLNARLAPGIYLGLLPLVCSAGGCLHLGGEGVVVDWLVRMRRLPDAQMLDAAIRDGTVKPAAVAAVADRLAEFFAAAPPVALAPGDFLARFAGEQAESRRLLGDAAFGLNGAEIAAVLGPVDALLREAPDLLCARLRGGCIVEGHGDLRPEHIFLGDPPAAIDCLEFSRRLRLLDPFEELAYLGMECAVQGADWIGPALIARCAACLSDPVPPLLIAFYTAFRAALRARQALAHLLDHPPRTPEKWLPLARRYLAAGALAASRLRMGGDHDLPA